MYLNVTNIETYNVDHDKFCIKWMAHRSATSYRIKLNPVNRKSRSCSHSSRQQKVRQSSEEQSESVEKCRFHNISSEVEPKTSEIHQKSLRES